jgi:NAD(P)-dependent dehydrogenase (short-subunit alcohol dehydrogenase family)
MRFEGQVAVVTGGAAGIGRSLVLKLAAEGGRPVIADVDEAGGQALVEAVAAAGGQALFKRTDILVETDIAGAIAAAEEKFGRLDLLFNNAGVPRTIAPDSEIADMTADKWRLTLDAHLTSTMLGCRYAIPAMIRAGGGAIVNTSSASALAATMDLAAYSAAKAGLHALTREVAVTYGRDNIRCNAVVPGAVMTERGRATLPPDIIRLFAEETPLQRLASPDNIADVALFLASDAAAMVTGQALLADGGMMSKLPYWLPKMRESRGEKFDATTYSPERDG